MAAAVVVVLAGGDRRERDTELVRDPDDFLHLLGRLRADRSRRTGRHLTANQVRVGVPGKVAVLGGDELRADDFAEAGDGVSDADSDTTGGSTLTTASPFGCGLVRGAAPSELRRPLRRRPVWPARAALDQRCAIRRRS